MRLTSGWAEACGKRHLPTPHHPSFYLALRLGAFACNQQPWQRLMDVRDLKWQED